MSENFNSEPDDRFAEQIAKELRSPERLASDFEARVLAQARAELAGRAAEAERTRSWWRQQRSFTLSPLAGLALAAGFAGLVALSTVAVSRGPVRVDTLRVASAADTVHLVRFVFADPSATSVAIVGDFNAWARGATQLVRGARAGTWTVSLPLSPGRHEYAFIVNGQEWVADPAAPTTTDEFGTESSVLLLAPSSSGAS